MKSYKIWDTAEKAYMIDFITNKPCEYISPLDAEERKEKELKAGAYPDKPHTVFEIHEFVDNQFRGKHS